MHAIRPAIELQFRTRTAQHNLGVKRSKQAGASEEASFLARGSIGLDISCLLGLLGSLRQMLLINMILYISGCPSASCKRNEFITLSLKAMINEPV
jgi:hypothetical protein